VGRASTLQVIPWHLPYNWRKSRITSIILNMKRCRSWVPLIRGGRSTLGQCECLPTYSTTLRWLLYPAVTAAVLWLRSNHSANYRGCMKWKESIAALAKQAPDLALKKAVKRHPAAPMEQWAGPSAEQMVLDEEWNHVVRRGRHFKATIPLPLLQIPLLGRSGILPSSLTWPPPGRRAGHRSLMPKTQQPLSRLLGSLSRKQPRV